MRSESMRCSCSCVRHAGALKHMMTPSWTSLPYGLVAWGGSALRRRLWWRERRQAARQAVRQAVQTVLGR